jgi:hypothetical protein
MYQALVRERPLKKLAMGLISAQHNVMIHMFAKQASASAASASHLQPPAHKLTCVHA